MKKLKDALETMQQLLGLLIDSELPLEKMLQCALEELMILVGAGHGNIMLLQQDKEHLAIVAMSGSFYEGTLGKQIPVNCFGWLIQNNKLVFLDKNSTFENLREQSYADSVSIPIKADNQIIGILNLIRVKGDLFTETELKMMDILAGHIGMAIMKKKIQEEMKNEHLKIIHSLVNIVDTRDHYTREHSARVNRFSLMIALEMGLSWSILKQICIASLLHDIGKISIPDSILLKHGNLTEEEFEIIKTHPVVGAEILGKHSRFKNIVPCVLHHHERWDGRGYPHGLSGEEIPLGARIICVADAFEAMTADRPYRRAVDQKQAVTELIRHRGTQFDPRVVQAFVKCFEGQYF